MGLRATASFDAGGSPADTTTTPMLTKSLHFSVFAVATAAVMGGACSSNSSGEPTGDAQSSESASGGSAGAGAGSDRGGSSGSSGSAGESGEGGDTSTTELAGPEFVDLGEATSGDTVFLDIKHGTLGFHVIVEDVNGTGRETVGIQVIRAPSGDYVNRDYVVQGAGFATGNAPYGVIAASVPQNPMNSAMPVEVGQWAFLIAGFSALRPSRPSARHVRHVLGAVARYVRVAVAASAPEPERTSASQKTMVLPRLVIQPSATASSSRMAER